MAGRRLSRIERRRDGLGVLREEAGGLRRGGGLSRRTVRRRSGRRVLKRLIDRSPPSSRRVLVDLGVGWEAHGKFC